MRVNQGSRLRFVLEKKKVNLAVLSKDLGVSRSTLYNYFLMDQIPVKKLEKVCEVAGVDVNEIFDSKTDPTTEFQALQERVRSLEKAIADKELIISQQAEIIELLKKQKHR